MNQLQKSATVLAASCEGSPIATTFVVCLFYIMFSVLEATIEMVIWRSRFTHWLDVPFQLVAICYAAYAVYHCAVYNSKKESK